MWRFGPVVVVTFLAVLRASDQAKLPSYFNRCSERSANLDGCVLKAANSAIPHIAIGDYQYGIPSLTPLLASEVRVRRDAVLRLIFRNAQIHGLENAKAIYTSLDTNDKTLEMKFVDPLLVLLGEYELDGRMLGRPVSGTGFGNFSLAGGLYNWKVQMELVNDGFDTFFSVANHTASFETKHAACVLQAYGVNDTNFIDFMNENQAAVVEELRPSLNRVISATFTFFLKTILKEVPINEIFKP